MTHPPIPTRAATPMSRARPADNDGGPGIRRRRSSSGCRTAGKNNASTKEKATSSTREKIWPSNHTPTAITMRRQLQAAATRTGQVTESKASRRSPSLIVGLRLGCYRGGAEYGQSEQPGQAASRARLEVEHRSLREVLEGPSVSRIEGGVG